MTSVSVSASVAAPTPVPAGSVGARRAWRIAASLVAALALVGGTVQVVGVIAHGEYSVERSFPSAGIDTVEVSTDNGSIRVVGGDTDTIDVRIDVSDGLLSTDRDVQVTGRTLVLGAECPWLAQWWCRTDFTLRVPLSTAVVVRGDPKTVSVTGVDGTVDLGVARQDR